MVCSQPSRAPGAFTEFVPRALPQSAFGDFDRDGRPDMALIQEGTHGPHVSVTMSGSPAVVTLDAQVVSVIAADIDQDGDVDLIAATTSGEVVTWINDSKGHFTVQETSHSHDLLPAAPVVSDAHNGPLTLAAPSTPVVSSDMTETSVVASPVRPDTAPLPFDVGRPILPSLRAPPSPFQIA
jgi:hypothetical protein